MGIPRHVERCGPGETAAAPRPGDFILVRGHDAISAVIYAFQRRRFPRPEDRPYTHWSHAALVTSEAGRLVEAGPRGLVAQSLAKYRNAEYHYVRVEAPLRGRWRAAALAERCVGQRYAVLTFLALGLSALLGDRLPVADRGQQTCVALVARALRLMTGIALPRAAAAMMPADLAKLLDITPATAPAAGRPPGPPEGSEA